ncbi:MAG: hypothetical protein ACXW4E_01405 [Anaerolineales bacterium]
MNSVGKYIRFIFKNLKAFRASKKLYEVRTHLALANMEISKISLHDQFFARRVEEFNEVMVVLTTAKWKTACAMEAATKADAQKYWKEAFSAIDKSARMSLQLLSAVQSGDPKPLGFAKTILTDQGTEIQFAGDTPLVPEINPVIILKGSDFQMGYQYAQQLIQIFGAWILRRKTGKHFSAQELECIHQWEAQIRIYAPEILEMCKGWAAGAHDNGVTMSYEDVLDLWTGHKPPSKTLLGLADGEPFMAPPFCSGAAAWGRATTDGKLVTVSTGDHDAHHMVTIVAYPETGNSFIISPFSATGDLAKLGGIYMFGHPGMNSKGLAYVEHGGMPKMVEPRQYWGYGLRMGTAVFHILRFANSAKEALEMELSFPIGDIGSGGFGSLGGFWADSSYGYILDSRKDPVIVREAGMMGETDFLCAANSPLHPDASKAAWMQSDMQNWHWDPKGGWYANFRPVKKIGIDEEVIVQSLGNGFIGSRDRTVYLHNTLEPAIGKIDFEYMKMLNRQRYPLPKPTWKETVASFNQSGSWGDISTGHASNADVVVMKPDADGQGLYAMCVGAARRGLAPVMPTWCSPIYNETNTFWELKLAPGPVKMVNEANKTAQQNIQKAQTVWDELASMDSARLFLADFLGLSRAEYEKGQALEVLALANPGTDQIYILAKALRAYTRAQVRANQVIEALCPPPSKPGDFGI